MALVTTASLVAAAQAARVGVGAFNVVQLENVEAILSGATAADRPVILQVSQNAVRYHGALAPIARACMAAAEAASCDASIHLDHAEDVDLVREAIDLGFSSVMYDASTMEYAANVDATAAVTQTCHEAGLWVEAELGEVGGKQGVHAPGVRTDPEEAAAFVAATGVDALAVAVGSSHKMVERTARLDDDLIARLAVAVQRPLVLHGSSGVDDDGMRAAIVAGITKVNVATQLNKVFTAAVRSVLTTSPAEVDPRRYLGPGRAAMATEAARLLTVIAG